MSDAHKLIAQIGAGIEATVMNSMVPIYKDVDGGVDFDRTGVLFRIGSEHFVITAAHGIAEYVEKDIWLYADTSERLPAPIPLVNSRFFGTEVDDDYPDRDIAAIHLDSDAVEQFYPQRKFLTLADCDQNVEPKPGLYMVAGYPLDTFSMHPVAEGEAVFYFSSVKPNPKMVNFDPQAHLSLALESYGLTSNGNGFLRAEIPPFFGMSGCGIWRVASLDVVRDPDLWNASSVRLVAIQNRADSKDHTIGTWFKYVVERIVDDLPAVKSATELEYTLGY